MKNITLALLLAMLTVACTTKKIGSLSNTDNTIESNETWDDGHPDQQFSYTTDEAFANGLLDVLATIDENDILVAEKQGDEAVINVYLGMAPFWWDPSIMQDE